MQDFNLKELQVIREGLEAMIFKSDPESLKDAIQKVDSMLEAKGYKFVIKAFHTEFKKLDKK